MRAPAKRGVSGLVVSSLAISLACLALACSPDRTMLVVRVQSNLDVPDAMDTVRVVVRHGGKEIQSLPFPLVTGTHKLPLEIGLLSPSGGGTGVGITVTGLQGTTSVVSQEAVTSFIKGKSLLLEMFLAAECVNFDCQDPAKTCTRGRECIDRAKVPATLPVFAPEKDAAAAADGKDDRGAAGTSAAGTGGGTDAGAGAGDGGTGGGAGVGGDASSDQVDARVEVAPEVPACVPVAEDCFNGKDDDCDGMPDCADPDCAPTSICVPRPAGVVGQTVDTAAPCPTGFGASPTQLGGGITASSSCAGTCSCAPKGTVSCSAKLYTQTDPASCALNTGGKYVYTMSTLDPDLCPIPDTNTGNVYGARLDPWAVVAACAAATGTPTKPAALWGKSLKFCGADKVDVAVTNGCAAGSVCMPRGAPGRSCTLLDTTGQCPAGTNADLLYTDFTDTRTCAPCACGASGATCDNLYVKMGSDYSCMNVDMGHIKGGMATCANQAFGVYVPGYELVGTPVAPTCTATSAVSGALTPTGGRTICCVP